jgi:hypothetical protein
MLLSKKETDCPVYKKGDKCNNDTSFIPPFLSFITATMGSTISKAKQQLHFKTFVSQAKAPSSPCSTKTEIQSSTLVLVRSQNKSVSRTRKTKHRRHHHVGKVSVQSKRAKPKYKRVTKSIIGKPTNFKHTGHMGAGDILESSVDVS